MQQPFLSPPWPASIPRTFKPALRMHMPLRGGERMSSIDRLALEQAYRLKARSERVRCMVPGFPMYLLGVSGNDGAYTANANSNSKTSLLVGGKLLPTIPANFFDLVGGGIGRGISFDAWGVIGTTGTPTITMYLNLTTTSGATSPPNGSVIAQSPSITTSSGVTNKPWHFHVDAMCSVSGQGTGNTTLHVRGFLSFPAGGSSVSGAGALQYALTKDGNDDATSTVTMDCTQQQYLDLSSTWGTASASNTQTCEFWRLSAWA